MESMICNVSKIPHEIFRLVCAVNEADCINI